MPGMKRAGRDAGSKASPVVADVLGRLAIAVER